MLPIGMMLGGVSTFLKDNWKPIVIILVVLGAYWHYTSLINKIEEQATEIVQLKYENALCENNAAKLKSGIDDQNKEIQKWVNVGKKTEMEMKKLKEELEKRRRQAEAELQHILQEPKPQTCEAAIKYLIDAKGDLTW